MLECFWYFIDSVATSSSTAEKRKGDSLLTGDRNNINTNWRKRETFKLCTDILFVSVKKLFSHFVCCPYIFGLNDLYLLPKKETYRKGQGKRREKNDRRIVWYLTTVRFEPGSARMGGKRYVDHEDTYPSKTEIIWLSQQKYDSVLFDSLLDPQMKRKTLLLCLKFNERLISWPGESKHPLREKKCFLFFLWFHLTCGWMLIYIQLYFKIAFWVTPRLTTVSFIVTNSD